MLISKGHPVWVSFQFIRARVGCRQFLFQRGVIYDPKLNVASSLPVCFLGLLRTWECVRRNRASRARVPNFRQRRVSRFRNWLFFARDFPGPKFIFLPAYFSSQKGFQCSLRVTMILVSRILFKEMPEALFIFESLVTFAHRRGKGINREKESSRKNINLR